MACELVHICTRAYVHGCACAQGMGVISPSTGRPFASAYPPINTLANACPPHPQWTPHRERQTLSKAHAWFPLGGRASCPPCFSRPWRETLILLHGGEVTGKAHCRGRETLDSRGIRWRAGRWHCEGWLSACTHACMHTCMCARMHVCTGHGRHFPLSRPAFRICLARRHPAHQPLRTPTRSGFPPTAVGARGMRLKFFRTSSLAVYGSRVAGPGLLAA